MFLKTDFLSLGGTAKIDEFGRLHVDAILGRVGVQSYPELDQPVRQFRSPEVVEASVRPDTIITLDHPSVVVTAQNASKYQVGYATNIRYEDGLVKAHLVVTDSMAVQAALSTHKQLSLGYLDTVITQDGIWVDDQGIQGEVGQQYEYDAIQTDIKINHVALVPKGRAGSIASLMLDSLLVVEETLKRTPMQIIYKNEVLTLDADNATKIKTVFDTIQEELAVANSKLDSMIVDHQSELETTQAKLDATQAKLDAKVEPKLDADLITSEIESRVKVWQQAGKIDSMNVSLTAPQAMRQLLIESKPELAEKLAAKTDSYVETYWEIYQEEKGSKEDSAKQMFVSDSIPKTDSKSMIAKRQANLIGVRK